MAQITVKKAWGSNGGIVEQYWPGTYLYLNSAKLRRLYQDNYIFCPANASGDKFFLTTSVQGFPIKAQLTELKNRGIDVIWTGQGSFYNSTLYTDTPPSGPPRLGARVSLLMPLMDRTADPNLASSYNKIARLYFNVARIYGNNPVGGLLTSEVSTGADNPSYYPTDLTGGPNNNGTGLNLIKYIEICNEWNLSELFGTEAGTVKFTYQSYATCFKACYDAIKLGDPNMRVILGGLYNSGSIATQNALVSALQTAFGGTIPSDVIFNWHIYIVTPQDGSYTPFVPTTTEQVVIPKAYLNSSIDGNFLNLIKKWDAYGYDWMVTEFSWDCSQFSAQNAVPILSGTTGTSQQRAEKSMGILDVRFSLLALCSKRCIGAVKYWLTDQGSNPNSPVKFGTMGIYNQNTGDYLTGPPGTPKECLTYYDEFMAQMGNCVLPLQLTSFNGTYKAVGTIQGTKTKVMATWDDNSAVTYTTIP